MSQPYETTEEIIKAVDVIIDSPDSDDEKLERILEVVIGRKKSSPDKSSSGPSKKEKASSPSEALKEATKKVKKASKAQKEILKEMLDKHFHPINTRGGPGPAPEPIDRQRKPDKIKNQKDEIPKYQYNKEFKQFDEDHNLFTKNAGALGFRKTIKSILKDNQLYRKQEGMKSGKLTHKNLYKVGLTDKIFTQKIIPGKKNYNVFFLVDCSGSMYQSYDAINYDKHISGVAGLSMAVLAKNLQDICNLKIAGFNKNIVSFKDYDEKLTNRQIKEMATQISITDTRTKFESDKNKFDLINVDGRGDRGASTNYDGLFLEMAVRDIRKQDGKKMIIVLSDGAPCTHPKTLEERKLGGNQHLYSAVKEANQSGVLTLGIGINSSAVQRFYPHNKIVTNESEILKTCLQLIRQNVRRIR